MADNDHLSDAMGHIINFITDQVRDLFYRKTTEWNWSGWIQAALLLERAVIPCEYYFQLEDLYELAEKILKISSEHDDKIDYFQGDGKGGHVKKWTQDLTTTMKKIEEWIKNKDKF